MQPTEINSCINKEVTIWGLKLFGLIIGGVFGVVVMVRYDFTFSIAGIAAGYMAGSYLSNYLYKGKLQRWIYWHLPVGKLLGGAMLPASWKRSWN